jgi:hypothetical protein
MLTLLPLLSCRRAIVLLLLLLLLLQLSACIACC